MQPLKGLTVVTLEHAIAAPFATRQLADLGARVIKIERPGTGDFARGYDARVRGMASHFVWTNRSKESLTLDVKHPEAAGILTRLVAKADVLVQNLAPGAAARLGLSYGALRERSPRLIVCSRQIHLPSCCTRTNVRPSGVRCLVGANRSASADAIGRLSGSGKPSFL
jgi:crotonobetainyl-CoA:carnitine CoA-transferase CaiB-like acyl-CoA transferase